MGCDACAEGLDLSHAVRDYFAVLAYGLFLRREPVDLRRVQAELLLQRAHELAANALTALPLLPGALVSVGALVSFTFGGSCLLSPLPALPPLFEEAPASAEAAAAAELTKDSSAPLSLKATWSGAAGERISSMQSRNSLTLVCCARLLATKRSTVALTSRRSRFGCRSSASCAKAGACPPPRDPLEGVLEAAAAVPPSDLAPLACCAFFSASVSSLI